VDRYVGPCRCRRVFVPLAHRCRRLRHRLRQRLGLAGLPLILTATLGAAVLSSPASQAEGQQATPSAATAAGSNPGTKGAQVYCFMRASGNDHQVSWDAAYAVIKRQSDRLFKTSPEHAAVMITEAVVQSPDTYPDCSRYLGDLFRKPEPQPGASAPATRTGVTRSDRLGQ
jgi:hypothetical protein